MDNIIFVLVQILILIAFCYVFTKSITELPEDPTDVEEIASGIMDRYKFLGREKYKFAIFNSKTKFFSVYETSSTNVLKLEDVKMDPELYYYDVPKSQFKLLNVSTIEVSLQDGRIVFTYDGQSTSESLQGLLWDGKKLSRDDSCTPGSIHGVTMNEYKRYFNTPVSLGVSNSQHKYLYFSCNEKGERVLEHCQSGTKYDGTKCVSEVGRTVRTRLDDASISFLPKDTMSYVKIEPSRVRVIECPNGVDSSGVSCNDIRCINKNGLNMIPHSNLHYTNNLKADKLYEHSYTCVDGSVTSTTSCSYAEEKTIQIKESSNMLEYIVRYPSEFMDSSGTCVTVNPSIHLKPVRVPITVYSYMALSNSLEVIFSETGEIIWRQASNVYHPTFKVGHIIPDATDPQRVFRITDGETSKSTHYRNSFLIHKNKFYQAKIKLPEITINPVNHPYAHIVWSDDYSLCCSVIGKTILDYTTFCDNGDEYATCLEKIKESLFQVIDNDFFHIPSVGPFLRRHEGKPAKYVNTATIYGLSVLPIGVDAQDKLVARQLDWTSKEAFKADMSHHFNSEVTISGNKKIDEPPSVPLNVSINDMNQYFNSERASNPDTDYAV